MRSERVYLPGLAPETWRHVNEVISLLAVLSTHPHVTGDDHRAVLDALGALRYLSSATWREVQLIDRPAYEREGGGAG